MNNYKCNTNITYPGLVKEHLDLLVITESAINTEYVLVISHKIADIFDI